jgi:hypothetical protein
MGTNISGKRAIFTVLYPEDGCKRTLRNGGNRYQTTRFQNLQYLNFKLPLPYNHLSQVTSHIFFINILTFTTRNLFTCLEQWKFKEKVEVTKERINNRSVE